MARKSMVAERRAEISQGLYRCIAKRGYANTSVRDIAREAGLGLGLITHYFDSKDEILYTMTQSIFEKYQRNMLLLFRQRQDKPPRERLRMGMDFFFVKISGDRDLIKVFHELWNLSHHDRRLRNSLKTVYSQYRAEVAGAISESFGKAGESAGRAEALSAFLVSAAEGAAIQWFLDPKNIDLQTLAGLANQFVDNCFESQS